MDILRRIATEDEPVVVVGMGAYFSGTRAQPSADEVSILFRITDLNVKVVRRGPANEPWQADCRMDLIEDRNPVIPITAITPIVYDVEPVAKTTTNSNGNKSGKPKPRSTPKPDEKPAKVYTDIPHQSRHVFTSRTAGAS